MSLFHRKVEVKQKTKIEYTKELFKTLLWLTIGAFIVAFALESFMFPHQIFDGGVIGVAMMLSYLTHIQLGLLIFVINLPFIILAYQKFGIKFVLLTFYAVSMLSIATNIMHWEIATKDPLLAPVFGGIILGFGVGLVLKNNASLDGTEIMSINLSQKFSFMTVGEFLMSFNLVIYATAGIMFGWDKAMYSIMTYFIASKTIDLVMEGFNSSKSVRIVSEYYKDVGDAIMKGLDVSVTYIKSKGGYSGKDNVLTFCVISRLEMAKLKQIVRDIDPKAFIVIEDVHEVEGVRVKKK